jgi:hypothetical protein
MTSPAIRFDAKRERAGGVAALYLALALVAAIPYFLVVVDYPSAETAADKVDLVVTNYPSMYVMYLATYVVFGLAIGVVALTLYDRLRGRSPLTARVATAFGLTWSFALVASGLVFTYGMTTINDLAVTDHTQAVAAWLAIEPIALALGGAGGELLGGLWVLTLSGMALRSGGLPKILGWLGVLIGFTGLISVVPPLHNASVVFGLLQIVWLGWLGLVLLTTKESSGADTRLPVVDGSDLIGTEARR